MKPEEVHQLLRSRKSVFPRQYIQKEISRDVLMHILESANWAPTHKLTEPWRFKVFGGDALKKLGAFMAETYQQMMPPEQFSEIKMEKLRNNPPKAGYVIGICMKRDAKESLPEWEELAAVSCAVQNLWLAATAHGLGGYWSTPEVISRLGDHIPLEDGESCLGLFYLSHYEEPDAPRNRGPVEDKIQWFE